MNGGILIALSGVWLGCQVFGGSALERMGIIGDGTAPSDPHKPKSAAAKGTSAGGKLGAVLGAAGGPVGSVVGAGAGGILGNAAGETVHLGKKIGEAIGGWMP